MACLRTNALMMPDRTAIIHRARDGFHTVSYAAFFERCQAHAAGFQRLGITGGTRTIVVQRPGPEVFEVLFALFAIGAVPVVVDPGMGLSRMLHCYRSTGAEALVGEPAAHALTLVRPGLFGDLRVRVTTGRRRVGGAVTLAETTLPRRSPTGPEPSAEDPLAIVFTTGSTGPAKGVEYTHGMLAAMADQSGELTGQTPWDVSLVTSPMFGLVDLLIGSTAVLAPLRPTKVASADPGALVDTITRFGVTTMFASPALLDRLGRYAARADLRLTGIRRVVSGGAPVSPAVISLVQRMLGEPVAGRFIVSYGATEALPIAAIDSVEALATASGSARGRGTCVGRPVPGIDLRVVGDLTASVRVNGCHSRVGEVVVAGPAVSRRYDRAGHAALKLVDGGRVWHRTGDLGHLDPDGRLWLVGRKSEAVRTREGLMFTVACEQVLDAHPDVHRTALVGVGPIDAQEPVVCVQPRRGVGRRRRRQVAHELRERADRCAAGHGITEILFRRRFPVDVRHNAKIGREQLAVWAASRSRMRRPGPMAACAVPVAGWLYLLCGLLGGFTHPVLVAGFWVVAALSVVAHAAQLPIALPRARGAGYAVPAGVALTFLFGAAWWRTLPSPRRS